MWLDNMFPFAVSAPPILNTKESERWAKYENDRQYIDLFTRAVNLALNIFEWEGLPETCDHYFLESLLLYHGFACIVYDPDMGYLTLPCMPGQYQNLYYEHNYYVAYSINYRKQFMALTHYNKDIFEKIASNADSGNTGEIPLKGVVCYDNQMRYPMINTIDIFTCKRVDAVRTIDVCAKGLKIPAIIETDEDTKVSIQKAITNIDYNAPVIYAGKGIAKAIKETKQVPTGFVAQNLTEAWNHKNNVDGDFYTAFGVNNLNTADKKERLITDEVNSNDEQIALNAYTRLDMRLHFIENLKAVFPDAFANATCKIKHQDENSATKEGGDEDGDSYNDPGRNGGDSGDKPV